MMSHADHTDLQQLTRSVAALTQALEHSERRYAQLARALRWGALTLSLLLLTGGAVLFGRFGTAQAQTPAPAQTADLLQALHNIHQDLAVFGRVGQAFDKAAPTIGPRLLANEDAKAYLTSYLNARSIPVTQDKMMEYAAPALAQSAVDTLLDGVVLMQQMRQDPSSFQDLVAGPTPVLRGLERELELMNRSLASLPAMAMQLDLMNRNIAALTLGISTATGRTGSWTP